MLRFLGLLCFYLLLMANGQAAGNNLTLDKLEVNAAQKELKFEIKWNHSWNLAGIKPPFNYDATWVFVKYQTVNGQWKHLDLSSKADHHTVDNNVLSIIPTQDQKGAFIKRSAKGSGNIPLATITLKWDQLEKGKVNFRLFGIEMVKVPTDSFYLGDGASNGTFRKGDQNQPYLVKSESGIKVGNKNNELTSAPMDRKTYDPSSDIPKDFPKGYEGFYAMKYEISQSQYAAFLNCLTKDQQAARTYAQPTATQKTYALTTNASNRNGIAIEQSANNGAPATYSANVNDNNPFGEQDDGQTRACNFLSWSDVAAYLDWAGLRPMTEMEYEKACRGPKNPKNNEFAWGTQKIMDANNVIKDGTPHETVDTTLPPEHGLASHGYVGPQGPLRTGFAADSNTSRREAGASYYGIMELSGNIWEICVATNSQGLQFTGVHGDGTLAPDGNANVNKWPSKDGNGAGYRGGAFNSGIIPGFRDLAVSDRFYGFDQPDTRRKTSGGRGVRSLK